MSSKLSSIRTALAAAISGMTTAGGYNLAWDAGTVNPTGGDWNAIAATAYPIADFWFGEEQCENGDLNTQTIINVLTAELDVIPKKVSNAAADVDQAIQDIKKLQGNNPSITNTCLYWWVDSWKRFNDQTHYPEYGARLTIKIRYVEIRTNP
jgi:hypothetical protein